MADPPFVDASRAAYDSVADDYAERFQDELAAKPLDRALLAAFAEVVLATGNGLTADLGCGPGHVTAHLQMLGLNAFGVDISAGMIALARRAHPDLRFDQGSMTNLDLPDGALGGIVALYSIIHIPPDHLPAVFAEFHRVLTPGGYVLLAFQLGATGDEHRHLTEWFGKPVSLDAYLPRPERIIELLGEAGLVTRARLEREPEEGVETAQRAYLLARS